MLKDKKFWIGSAVSVLLLILSVRGVDWSALSEAMAKANWNWMLLALPLYLVGYWSRAKRVSQILKPIKAVPANAVLRPLVIGFMFNNILPLRLGEFVFAYLLGKREGMPAMDSTGLHALGEIVRRSRGEGTRVILSDVHSQPMAALGRSRLLDELGDENLLGSLDEALAAARAQLGLPPES